jgi:hypothetical protein
MYAGCVSGAIQMKEYLSVIETTGFANIQIQKEKRIVLPNQLLADYLSADEISKLSKGELGIYSITVYAEKPGDLKMQPTDEVKNKNTKEACCEPGCCN